MLCVQSPSLYPNYLAKDMSCMSIQDEHNKPTKIRRIESYTSGEDIFSNITYNEKTSNAFQSEYIQEKATASNSLKRKIPVRSSPEFQDYSNGQNYKSMGRKEESKQEIKNISEIQMHEELNEVVSDANDFLSSLVIRELKPNYTQNLDDRESDKQIDNKNAIVLYKEPVNLVRRLINESSKEDDMEIE